MQRLGGAVIGLFLFAGGASAAPLLAQPGTLRADPALQQVKIICDESGHCQRPPVRKPVARWVYGDGNFYGPYDGPGYFGNPRLRYRVFPYFWW